MNHKTLLQHILFRKSKNPTHVNYIPVLGFEHLSEYYDIVMSLSGLGIRFKRKISKLVSLPQKPKRIVDIGCGTGTQLIALCETYPDADIVGIDIDTSLLKKAKERITPYNKKARVSLSSATHTNIGDSAIDLCFSTLVFHHLTHEQKISAFNEAFRILKPGGTFLLTDWGKLWFTPFRWLLIFEDQTRLEDHIQDKMPQLAQDAGFVILKSTKVKPTGIWSWELKKPETSV